MFNWYSFGNGGKQMYLQNIGRNLYVYLYVQMTVNTYIKNDELNAFITKNFEKKPELTTVPGLTSNVK
jgi:hypothetical protein